MNRVLFETGYLGDIRGNATIMLYLAVLLLFYFWWKWEAKREKKEKAAKLMSVASKGMLVYLIIEILVLIESYINIVLPYKNGDYVEIEGVVEDYREESLKGRSEYFTVDGVSFKCSYDGVAWGYQKQQQKRNEIIISGRHLKIRYIPLKHENVIVYIEQMMPEEGDTD